MTHALPLLLALACASDPAAAPPDAEAVEVPDFAVLKPADEARLEGRRALYRVRIVDQLCVLRRVGALYDVAAPGHEIVPLLLPGRAETRELTVEAELRMRYVPARAGRDGVFPGAWRYALEDAAVVGP
jgi:hypothetical protein